MAESDDRATVTMTSRDAGVDYPELPQDVQAGLVGQAQVEENNVRASGGDPFQALCARLGNLNPVCGRGEYVPHSIGEQVRVVVDQKQGGHVTRALRNGKILICVGHCTNPFASLDHRMSVATTMTRLHELALGLPRPGCDWEDRPRFEPPATPQSVIELERMAGFALPGDLRAFLEQTESIVAMSVHNGYWLGGINKLVEGDTFLPRVAEGGGSDSRGHRRWRQRISAWCEWSGLAMGSRNG